MTRNKAATLRWLPQARRWAAWPHAGSYFSPPAPDCIVFHFTALSGEQQTVQVLDRRRLSTHLFVGRSGKVLQLLPFDRIAWHAGASTFGGRSGFNQWSIGIEVENAGALTRRPDGFFSINDERVPAAEAAGAIHRYGCTEGYWHRFPAAQLSAVEEICRELVSGLGIGVFLGHDQVAPVRKVDPGPLFPMEKLSRMFFGGSTPDLCHELPRVILQLYSYPDHATGTALLRQPLTRDVERVVVDEENGWRRILFSLSGWVVHDAGCLVFSDGLAVTLADGVALYLRPQLQPENMRSAPLPRQSLLRIIEKSPGWLRVSVRMSGWLAPSCGAAALVSV